MDNGPFFLKIITDTLLLKDEWKRRWIVAPPGKKKLYQLRTEVAIARRDRVNFSISDNNSINSIFA